MEINKKNRTELKEYFKINDKPTQEEFADFIEAGLNQAEDGIAKVQGNPLSIQAEGEPLGTQEVLDVYESLTDDNPQWSFNLNPRVNSEEPNSNQPGFNIKDITGQSRLFIKSGEGNVGVGTLEPASKLTVESKNTSSLLSVIDTSNERTTIFEVSKKEDASFFQTKLGIGTNAPKAPLSITGTGKTSVPDEAMHITNNCILFGGGNAGQFEHSAKIAANENFGMRIFGMSSDQKESSRRLEIFAEGGMTTHGHIHIPQQYVVAFSVSLSTNMKGTKNPLQFKQVNYNMGGHFKDNRHFRAPIKGMYLFTMCMRHNTDDGDVGWKLRLNDTGFVNGAGSTEEERQERSWLIARTKLHMNSRTVLTLLQAGDKVHVEQFGSGGNDNYASGFEGILLQAVK
ncbi:C1q-like domain-containing protein [Aquimarina algiphila]|uniref:C1q-like domain-containing protein n=1 Tax=Aquimarina algiphila TaxID=2047982 RepID=UPI00232DF809|nr:hypothetical protein [Aquimarina algiphila]